MSKKKSKLEVNASQFGEALKELHWYHGELLANLEIAKDDDYGEEWVEDLEKQIATVKRIYNNFVFSSGDLELLYRDGNNKKIH